MTKCSFGQKQMQIYTIVEAEVYWASSPLLASKIRLWKWYELKIIKIFVEDPEVLKIKIYNQTPKLVHRFKSKNENMCAKGRV